VVGVTPFRVDLAYVDANGRVFDFHALRHQFISNLAAAGVHPKVAQTLARHSTITLTMDRYTHLGLMDQTTALDKLPDLPGPYGTKIPLAATGTDAVQRNPVAHRLHKPLMFPAGSLITGENERTELPANPSVPESIELIGVACAEEGMIIPENDERPRGGMADTGDLKSPPW
jgi:hypothetical protein